MKSIASRILETMELVKIQNFNSMWERGVNGINAALMQINHVYFFVHF